LTSAAAAQIIADLSTWQVHSPKAHDVLRAIRIQERYALAFWDAMIIASALQMVCPTLWSEDLNPGQRYEQLTVVNPFSTAS
jgi:predicted nucleic acid-binding protein